MYNPFLKRNKDEQLTNDKKDSYEEKIVYTGVAEGLNGYFKKNGEFSALNQEIVFQSLGTIVYIVLKNIEERQLYGHIFNTKDGKEYLKMVLPLLEELNSENFLKLLGWCGCERDKLLPSFIKLFSTFENKFEATNIGYLQSYLLAKDFIISNWNNYRMISLAFDGKLVKNTLQSTYSNQNKLKTLIPLHDYMISGIGRQTKYEDFVTSLLNEKNNQFADELITNFENGVESIVYNKNWLDFKNWLSNTKKEDFSNKDIYFPDEFQRLREEFHNQKINLYQYITEWMRLVQLGVSYHFNIEDIAAPEDKNLLENYFKHIKESSHNYTVGGLGETKAFTIINGLSKEKTDQYRTKIFELYEKNNYLQSTLNSYTEVKRSYLESLPALTIETVGSELEAIYRAYTTFNPTTKDEKVRVSTTAIVLLLYALLRVDEENAINYVFPSEPLKAVAKKIKEELEAKKLDGFMKENIEQHGTKSVVNGRGYIAEEDRKSYLEAVVRLFSYSEDLIINIELLDSFKKEREAAIERLKSIK